MGSPWGQVLVRCALFPLLILILLLQEDSCALSTPAIAAIVETGQSAVYRHRVEAEIGGKVVYSGVGLVEAARYNADTLIILTTNDANEQDKPLVSGSGLGRAIVVKTLAGRVNSLLHQKENDISLNYKRALASLLTPALHSSSLAYHTQNDILGTCEVRYEHTGLTTMTWRDLTQCSHFTSESVLGVHNLPLLHLNLDVLGSDSQCEYQWRERSGGGVGAGVEAEGILEGAACVETLRVAPRYTNKESILNITLSSTLTHTVTTTFNPATYNYLQEATELTDLGYHSILEEDEHAASNASGLLKEMCSSGGDGRLTSSLLQKLSQFTHALARSSSSSLPYLTSTCPVPIRRLVALAAAIVGGPHALPFFVMQLAEFSRIPEGPIKYGEEFLFTMALKNLVSPTHHSASSLPIDYFTRRENQMVYEELVDYLLDQDSPAVAGVATLLEGLKKGAPQLFERLLEKSSPFLSPAEACEDGRHDEAIRRMRVSSGLSSRPFGYVASLRPCFATEDVGVAVAAMDTLTDVDCDIQGVTELQKLGLESPSDPEIRIAAYRGLVHCLLKRPKLMETVADALDPTHDAFSTQVASYVWSHIQSVLKSDDPSQVALKDLLISSEIISRSHDPVWYDPRQHSRHLSHTVDVDARTALTISGDLIWGRYSPAPRALYLKVVLHHDGETYDLTQVMVRVTGLEAMILNLPGVEELFRYVSGKATGLWSHFASFAQKALRNKREITHVQIAEFIDHVMSRIPADYRSGISSAEVSLKILGQHALHVRLVDLHNTSIGDSLSRMIKGPLRAAVLGLMPLMDNTYTMATLSGVPVSIGVNGIAGVNSAFMHVSGGMGGMLKLLASGGVSMKTQVTVGQSKVQTPISGQRLNEGHHAALSSGYIWSVDLPFSASYEHKGEDTRITLRTAENWSGRFLHHQRETSVAGEVIHMRVTQDCIGVNEPLELCVDTLTYGSSHEDTPTSVPVERSDMPLDTRKAPPDGDRSWLGQYLSDEGRPPLEEVKPTALIPPGWLMPHGWFLHLLLSSPGEPVILTVSAPTMPGAITRKILAEIGSEKYDSSFVLQLIPTPTFALTLNSPLHTYLLKGSRESITQMAGLEVSFDRHKYGIRAQLSTPVLVNKRVWSPSVFITTPERGEEEVLRAFLSWKDSKEVVTTEFSFQTIGKLVNYLNLAMAVDMSWSTHQLNGEIQELQFKKLQLVYPNVFGINASGEILGAGTRNSQASVKVSWGIDDGEVEVALSRGPVVTFIGLSEELREDDKETLVAGREGGTRWHLDFNLKHKLIPEALQAKIDLLFDRGRVDASLKFALSETGGFNVTHITNGMLDYKTTASVIYTPLDVFWSGEHELIIREDEVRHFMKVSWSPRPQDFASSLVHYVSHNILALDMSIKLMLVYPGQVIELENSLAEARGGSFKNKLEFKMDPGRSMTMDTVLIYRNEPGVFSYGLSNTFKLDTWINPLSIVGTINCYTGGKCQVALSAVQSGDQLADIEVQHIGAGGVSRSDATISITDWFNGAVSLDAAYALGFYDIKWEMALWPWATLSTGRAEVDISSPDVAVVEIIFQELYEDYRGAVTHSYNATLNLNPEIRTLFSRQEVRVMNGSQELLWVAVVQGRAGEQLLNSRHFGKATLVTPSGMYYIASGDVNSKVNGLESVAGGVSLSAGAGPQASYLLSWNMNLYKPNSTDESSLLDLGNFEGPKILEKVESDTDNFPLEDLETLQEEPLESKDSGTTRKASLTLETLLRGMSPATGEVKLRIKARKTEFPKVKTDFLGSVEASEGGIEKYDADIRLISENEPELGRIHGSLTRSFGEYSLNGRMWSGQRSIGVVSYGMSRNESIKTSQSAVIIDPTTTWRRLEVITNSDHLGTFPFNFQSSGDGKIMVGFEELGSVRALAQWTPVDAAVDLGFRSYFDVLPAGNIQAKLSPDAIQGAVSWRDIKAISRLQWSDHGRSVQLALNYDNPGSTLNDMDAIVTFSISPPPYPPVTLGIVGRISINAVQHYVLNVDCRSEQEEYLVTGALVRPGGSGSLRLQMRKSGDTYGAVGALVLEGFSGQISGSLTYLDPGEDIQLSIHSTLLKEAKGYTIRIARKFDESHNAEVLIQFSQAGEIREWMYVYKVLLEMEKDIKSRLRRLRIEDHFTYKEFDDVLHSYNFLILVAHNKYDELEIEIEFPDIWSEVKVSGTVVKGKDSQLDLVFVTPSVKHLLEGRLIFGSDSWRSSHSGSFTYTQQGKKGRGQPFKLEVEGLKWNSNRQKYKLSLQKMLNDFTISEYSSKIEDSTYTLNDAGMMYTNFEAALDILHDTGSSEYKMNWETDKTKNVAKLILEEDLSGGKALLRYMRSINAQPKSEIEYEVKLNYRRFDTEIMLSATVDHTFFNRPRAVSFLHSEAEGYTELVLDLFRDEGDQVILVITYLPENFRFRIGQFGNTFLQVGYQESMSADDEVFHIVELESSGWSLELWIATAPDGLRTCQKGGFTLQTPSLAPTHNALIYCPSPSPELTMQVLGVEEHEGPYLRVGQISGPGGIGIQVGSGRLIPLDTPPALTLTADVDKEVIEFLFDWQSPSVAQLKEDLSSRGTSLVAAMEGLGRVEIQVEGSLDILDLLEDSQTLLEEAGELISSVVGHIIIHLLDQAPEVKLGEFMTISLRGVIEYLVERVKGPLETLVAWWDVALNFTDRLIETVEASVLDIFEEISYMIDDVVEPIVEVFSDAWNMVESSVRPPLLRIQAAIASLAYNDDQSLYALISRVMGEVRSEAGRHKGLAGFFYSNILTKVERWLVKRARWDEIRAKSTQILQYLRQFTTFDAVMPHSTALKLRVSTPPKFARDFKSVALKFRDHHWPKLLSESKEWVESQWSRVRYLLTWHIRGESVVFGWDQAITWDGRQVTPMLSDSCHHMLVLLINAQPPTAITIHLKDLNSNPRKVFTVFSGEDRITIDTNLKMTYNNQHVRRPQLEIGELTLTREPGKATVSSSSGLTLECESKFDTCRLEVSWENFAATAGLLGVFDFDNNTDFMTSGWEMPATESEWAQSWRVAGMEECSSALPETDDDQVSEEECTSLFDDTKSPFRSCFFSVPPSPYLETCRTGWSCGSEASYLHACQRHYHDLMPNLTTCGACDPSEIEEEGGTDGLAHEIVIITDFNCLEDMQDLITALVKDQEKTHTIVVRYIGRGTPSYGPFDDVTETVVDSATAPLDAVANAVALDFSPKALKSIVLFDCDHPMCTVSMTSSKFFSLQAELLKQGIQVHVITQDPLLILQPDAFTNKAKRQLIGLDARTIYTMSHARKRQVRGKRRLREHVTTPMGNTCASLAVQTDGAVFSLHQLKIERKYHRKIYQQLLAARVREGQSAEYLNCRKCECNVPCSLCHPQKPFEYAKSTKDDDEDEEDEDYEDEEDEERDKRKKKKKSQRMRGN